MKTIAMRAVVIACAKERSLEMVGIPIPSSLQPQLRIERYSEGLVGACGGNAVKPARLLADDVHDDGLALHVDTGSAATDEIDAFDLRGGQARENSDKIIGLACRALPINQHIARRIGEAAHIAAVIEHEAGYALDHIERRVEPHRREKRCRIANDCAGRRGCTRGT